MTEKERNVVLGARLKEVRKKLDLSQEEFGIKLGEKQRTISYMEDGRRGVLCTFTIKLEEEFNVDIIWFLKGEGEMFIKKDTPI